MAPVPEQRALLPDATADELQTLSQLDVGGVPPDKWARNLVEFLEQVELTYKRDGMSSDEAFRLASLAVRSLAEYHGGSQFYLPRGDDLLTALRHAEIYHRANRDNIQLLANEYELTDRQIYRICSQQRALYVRKSQGRLFDKEGS